MSGVHWQRRFDSLRDLQREVGRLFESFDPLNHRRAPRAFPPLNLVDAGDRYVMTILLPGVAVEDVDLSITGEILNLRGERRKSDGVPDESYRRQERLFGRWSRTVTLPERVESDLVAANFTDGVLKVTLPKLESARPRQINVTSGPG